MSVSQEQNELVKQIAFSLKELLTNLNDSVKIVSAVSKAFGLIKKFVSFFDNEQNITTELTCASVKLLQTVKVHAEWLKQHPQISSHEESSTGEKVNAATRNVSRFLRTAHQALSLSTPTSRSPSPSSVESSPRAPPRVSSASNRSNLSVRQSMLVLGNDDNSTHGRITSLRTTAQNIRNNISELLTTYRDGKSANEAVPQTAELGRNVKKIIADARLLHSTKFETEIRALASALTILVQLVKTHVHSSSFEEAVDFVERSMDVSTSVKALAIRMAEVIRGSITKNPTDTPSGEAPLPLDAVNEIERAVARVTSYVTDDSVKAQRSLEEDTAHTRERQAKVENIVAVLESHSQELTSFYAKLEKSYGALVSDTQKILVFSRSDRAPPRTADLIGDLETVCVTNDRYWNQFHRAHTMHSTTLARLDEDWASLLADVQVLVGKRTELMADYSHTSRINRDTAHTRIQAVRAQPLRRAIDAILGEVAKGFEERFQQFKQAMAKLREKLDAVFQQENALLKKRRDILKEERYRITAEAEHLDVWRASLLATRKNMQHFSLSFSNPSSVVASVSLVDRAASPQHDLFVGLDSDEDGDIPTTGTACTTRVESRRTPSGVVKPVLRYTVDSLLRRICQATAQLTQIEDLQILRNNISQLSKQNFRLRSDMKILDEKIALLIHNSVSCEEVAAFAENAGGTSTSATTSLAVAQLTSPKVKERYTNIFYLLQNKTRYLSTLCSTVSLVNAETLVHFIMFSLFGNQLDTREEKLLLAMLAQVLQTEFSHADHVGSLMRSNTTVTRLLTTYTRRGLGHSYLRSIVAPLIQDFMNTTTDSLEINPSLVYLEVVPKDSRIADLSVEEMAAHPEVARVVPAREAALVTAVTGFVDAIAGAVDAIPYGIRWICARLKALTEQRFPDLSEESVLSLVGGFFLLRYINPAIVAPQPLNLVNVKPPKTVSRGLVLIAKLFQNLNNRPDLQKEAYMTRPTEQILTVRKAVYYDMLRNICAIEDFTNRAEIHKYLQMAQEASTIEVTVNEIVNVHKLLVEYKSKIITDTDDRLAIVLNELEEPPAKVPRADDRTIRFTLISRWAHEADEKEKLPFEQCIFDETLNLLMGSLDHNTVVLTPTYTFKDSIAITTALDDAIYNARMAGDTFTARSAMMAKQNIDYFLTKEAQEAKEARAPASEAGNGSGGSGSGQTNSRSILREISRRYSTTVFEDASAGQASIVSMLVTEMNTSLRSLRALLETLPQELEQLRDAARQLEKSNLLCQDQLEAYREYVENVRAPAATGDSAKDKKAHSFKKTMAKRKFGEKLPHSLLVKSGLLLDTKLPAYNICDIGYVFRDVNKIKGQFAVDIVMKQHGPEEEPLFSIALTVKELLHACASNPRASHDTKVVTWNAELLLEFFNMATRPSAK